MPKKKPQPATYRVAGPNVVLGHEPGDTFEDVLDPILEERLVASRNLERVAASSESTTKHTDGAKAAAEKE